MKCPACLSSEILWDMKTGSIVCTNCGLVIDEIYYGFDIPVPSCQIEEYVNENGHKKLTYKELKLKINHKKIKEVIKLLDLIRKKPHLRLDTKAVEEFIVGKRPPVKLLKRRVNEVRIDNDVEKRIVGIIIEKIINPDPILASRTDRAKIALALIIEDLAVRGNVRRKYISKVTGLSKTHIHRLISLIKNRRDVLCKAMKYCSLYMSIR